MNLLPRVGGFGVDIFFVISGFIIAFITSRETEHFLVNRVFRIVPLYIIATIIMVLAYLAFPEKINRAVVTVPTFIKSILFIPYKIETKFELTGPILEQGWTLNYEMFFYMIMAVCILIVKNKKYSGILCASLLTFIFTFLNIINSKNFYFIYYQKSLIPEFVYGIILYYIYNYFVVKNKGYFLIRNSVLIEMVIMSSTIILSIIIYIVIDKPIQDFLKKALKNRAG